MGPARDAQSPPVVFWSVPCSSIPQQHTGCFLFSCQRFKLKLCYCVRDPQTPGRPAERQYGETMGSPTPPGLSVASHHLPPCPSLSPVTCAVTVSPILSPPRMVSRSLEVRSPRLCDGSGAGAAASDTQQTLSPPGSFGLKETIVFEILSLRVLVWLQTKQQPLLVEGDTGFASRRVEDFVMRARPWAQPGLMAVPRGHGHWLLGAARFSRASLLTGLFSGQ